MPGGCMHPAIPVITRRHWLASAAALPLFGRDAQAATTDWDRIAASGTLRLGIVENWPPYSRRNDDQWAGLVPSVASDLAAALGLAMQRPVGLQFVVTTWPSAVLDLQANRFDVFFGLSPNPEREKALRLFGPIYELPEVVITFHAARNADRWDNYNNPDTSIAVVLGSTDAQIARDMLPHAAINALPSVADTVLSLQSGHATAMITTLLTGLGVAASLGGRATLRTLQPSRSQASFGGARRDIDSRLSAFLAQWSQHFHQTGGSNRAIETAVHQFGLDPSRS